MGFQLKFPRLRTKNHIMQGMGYVEVLVADATYHGQEALTYSSETPLEKGRVVTVPLRAKEVIGVVTDTVGKPTFTAKPVISAPALPALPEPLLELWQWMRGYYPAPMGVLTQLFVPKQFPKKEVAIPKLPALQPPQLPPLTTDQQQALASIRGPGLHILHGETGTGKTRVYIELAQRCLATGRSAIILTPEIGLTSQLANNFREAFGDRVIIVHSQLTEVTRARSAP